MKRRDRRAYHRRRYREWRRVVAKLRTAKPEDIARAFTAFSAEGDDGRT